MKKLIALTSIAGMFLFQSCTAISGTTTGNQTTNLDISGKWTLTQISKDSGTDINTGFPNKKPSLILEAISKKATGNTGCNQMFGSFTTNQNKVNFSGMGMNKMYCHDVKENEYMAMFNQVSTYKVTENQLILMDKDGKELLTYSKTK